MKKTYLLFLVICGCNYQSSKPMVITTPPPPAVTIPGDLHLGDYVEYTSETSGVGQICAVKVTIDGDYYLDVARNSYGVSTVEEGLPLAAVAKLTSLK